MASVCHQPWVFGDTCSYQFSIGANNLTNRLKVVRNEEMLINTGIYNKCREVSLSGPSIFLISAFTYLPKIE